MNNSSILVVDDETDIRLLVEEILSEEGYRIHTAADAKAASVLYERENLDLVLLDIWMPETDGISLLRQWLNEGDLACPVVIMSGHGTVETAIEAIRLGAVDYIEKPLSLANLLKTVEKALERKIFPRAGQALLSKFSHPVGNSRTIQQTRELARQIASQTASVIILGESGSGRKEFAHFIHSLSAQADAPFVSISGGLLVDQVAAERLLGVNTADGFEPGLLEQAAGGTLFISEMTDVGSIAQKLLVSAVGSGEIARPGSNRIIGVDVRIIGSLQSSAHANHSDGEFRTDLLAALGVLQLRVPALREYREDIPQLLRQYAEALLDTEDLNYRRFSVAAQNRLRNYPWPGNISELKNLVQRLLAAGGPEEISLAELESQLLSTALKDEPLVKQDLLAMPLREAREHFERAYLKQQLELCNGKVGQLAKRVGMERTHLYRKLRSLRINSWRSIN